LSFVQELRAFLAARLPVALLPSAFVLLDALPLTSTGKLDRRALPPPDMQPPLVASAVAPRTPLEAVLAQLWAALLQRESVGIHDDFFALGGHSLLATQVIARIRSACAVELPLRALFASPTIAALAPQIAAAQLHERGLTSPPLRRADRTLPLPLAFAQQRLWFLDRLTPGSSAYTIATPVRLRGPLQLAALHTSLHALRQRHAVLRTSFPLHDDQPVQQIGAARALPLPLIDLHGLAAPQQDAALVQVLDAEARVAFDLARGPLLRTTLVRLDATTHALLLSLHHIIADGWSLGILVRELATLYAAEIDGRPATLPDLPIQYADYAIWQRDWLQAEVLDAQLAYWRQALADAPTLALPTDHPRPPLPSMRGARQGVRIAADLYAELRALSRRAGVTLFMTLFAAFDVLLAHRSDQTDIVVGTDVAGRTQIATEDLIGCFVNQLALRTNLAGDPSFDELLLRVRAVCLAAYTHQEAPFEQVVAAVGGARVASGMPLFQAKIVLQPTLVAEEQPGLTLERLTLAQTTAQLDLILSLHESAHGIEGMLNYSTDLFEADTIRHLVEHYEILLRSVVARPDARLSELAEIIRESDKIQRLRKAKEFEEADHQMLKRVKRKTVSILKR
jgi:Condensation domain/Phosphopantetheine attachment site